MDNKYVLIQKWLENQCNKKYWSDYLAVYKYDKIAIYGAGDLGRYLAMELKDSKIEIICFVDKRANELLKILNYPVVTFEDFINNYDAADAVIVSVTSAYEEVLEKIVDKSPEMPVMSLKDMLYEI